MVAPPDPLEPGELDVVKAPARTPAADQFGLVPTDVSLPLPVGAPPSPRHTSAEAPGKEPSRIPGTGLAILLDNPMTERQPRFGPLPSPGGLAFFRIGR